MSWKAVQQSTRLFSTRTTGGAGELDAGDQLGGGDGGVHSHPSVSGSRWQYSYGVTPAAHARHSAVRARQQIRGGGGTGEGGGGGGAVTS